MIDSCKDCQNNCCKTGPGPHRIVPPKQYVSMFGDFSAYNTRCAALSSTDERCTIWSKEDFPDDCKNYVCHLRSFTKEELRNIKGKKP